MFAVFESGDLKFRVELMVDKKLRESWFFIGNYIKDIGACRTHWELSRMVDSGIIDDDGDR